MVHLSFAVVAIQDSSFDVRFCVPLYLVSHFPGNVIFLQVMPVIDATALASTTKECQSKGRWSLYSTVDTAWSTFDIILSVVLHMWLFGFFKVRKVLNLDLVYTTES